LVAVRRSNPCGAKVRLLGKVKPTPSKRQELVGNAVLKSDTLVLAVFRSSMNSQPPGSGW
jgi:hypothetical protein